MIVMEHMTNIRDVCNACGKPLLLVNINVDDGCPCNSPRGVNVTPFSCSACKLPNCVKPLHRILAGAADAAEDQVQLCLGELGDDQPTNPIDPAKRSEIARHVHHRVARRVVSS